MAEGHGLDDRVFEVAATCSITCTADGFDLTGSDEASGGAARRKLSTPFTMYP
jgi:hypothetical protein